MSTPRSPNSPAPADCGTPIRHAATLAGISQAYVFKLFPGKIALFVAALNRCFELVENALSACAARVQGAEPEEILHKMGGAHAELIADNSLLILQGHAQSAADIPAIADAALPASPTSLRNDPVPRTAK